MGTATDHMDGEITPATISVTTAAKLLGIGRQTAYELARRGQLPGALRLGHRIVVSRYALTRFLEGDGSSTE
ncbi:MAG: helix-turn-helix domain-containing protein [Dehalococcoidia bacterium]|nr:helix-turn-helix domain-containing protein [Dehalococcoidia bacterium]